MSWRVSPSLGDNEDGSPLPDCFSGGNLFGGLHEHSIVSVFNCFPIVLIVVRWFDPLTKFSNYNTLFDAAFAISYDEL